MVFEGLKKGLAEAKVKREIKMEEKRKKRAMKEEKELEKMRRRRRRLESEASRADLRTREIEGIQSARARIGKARRIRREERFRPIREAGATLKKAHKALKARNIGAGLVVTRQQGSNLLGPSNMGANLLKPISTPKSKPKKKRRKKKRKKKSKRRKRRR